MLKDQSWKTVYRTGDDDILNDFYIPALTHAKNYDRAVGYFSSELLVSAAKGLSSLVKAEGKMRLVIGHPLDEDEYAAVKSGADSSWLIGDLKDRLLDLLSENGSDQHIYRLKLISWLIACGRLEIKFACRKRGMYHEKIGIITDIDNQKLIFQGSANETSYAMGLDFNAESISVYPSWTEAYSDYGKYYEDAFERIWEGRQRDTYTLDLPSRFYEEIAKRAAKSMNVNLDIESDIDEQALILNGMVLKSVEPSVPKVLGGEEFKVKDHQKAALEAWRGNSFQGIMKLATGSGKTITAIYGAVKIYESSPRLFMLVAVPYVDLARQWITVMRIFNIHAHECYDSKNSWYENLKSQIELYRTGQIKFIAAVVVNKTLTSSSFQDVISTIPRDNFLMIGDECHRHGSETVNSALPNARFRLGLSATPYQDDDDEIDSPFPNSSKLRLNDYYGSIIAEYSLSDAINDRILTPYEYYIHEVRLTEDEQDEYDDLSVRIQNLISSDSSRISGSKEQNSLSILCGQRSRLLGEASNKFIVLKALLSADGGLSKGHCLFYCPEGASGENDERQKNIDKVSKVLSQLSWRTSQFTSSEDKRTREEILRSFVAGGIDAIVAMKVLDEGIDIPVCRTAFILASTRNPRQYVQRRGRILRKFPGKDFAVIHDFVVLPASGREGSGASKSLIRAELERISDFQLMATNKKEIYSALNEMGI
ncbi:MAG TPA: DEAD/DEAH box helicase family protein [Methylotenera sp.]